MFFIEIFCAFVMSIVALPLIKLAIQWCEVPQALHEALFMFSGIFVLLCFGLYTLRAFSYELAYTIRKAINDADKDVK